MQNPSLPELNEIRKTGFRPEVVGCFVNDRKLLLLYKKEYKMWQLPQGGIENGETSEMTIVREMTEEIGKELMAKCDGNYSLVGGDSVEFAPTRYGVKELKTDEGQDILMKGKAYFFYVIQANSQEFSVEDTKYDDYFWLNYKAAMFLAQKVYQPGKRRILVNIINLLKSNNIID